MNLHVEYNKNTGQIRISGLPGHTYDGYVYLDEREATELVRKLADARDHIKFPPTWEAVA